MTAIEEVDNLIKITRGFFNLPNNPTFETPQYREFHDKLTDFIYRNHLENNKNWEVISDNLVYKSNQFMVSGEANRILVCLENIKRLLLSKKYEQFWQYIHPKIEAVAKDRFYNDMYADAIEAAMKEVNDRLKKIVKGIKGVEYDGADLMRKTFSQNTPILKIQDLTTDTGRNVQQGYMDIFAGVMTGIRNPKAHQNQTITREDAVRKLHLASLLMYKIDQALDSTNVKE